jgi:hypothetical protein
MVSLHHYSGIVMRRQDSISGRGMMRRMRKMPTAARDV